jgi:hypothetical protein
MGDSVLSSRRKWRMDPMDFVAGFPRRHVRRLRRLPAWLRQPAAGSKPSGTRSLTLGNAMSVAYDYLTRILHPMTPPDQRLPAIRSFAEELGWTPSYELPHSVVAEAIDHIVVEHGLENAAVLSFLQPPRQPADLGDDTLRSMLILSYNNLVEWHAFVSDTQVRYVSNRTFPHLDILKPLARNSTEYLSDHYFTRHIAEMTRKSNVPRCDDQLINVVSRWKRLIKTDYRDSVTNSNISSLFNAIMFVRACEDYMSLTSSNPEPLLLRIVSSGDAVEISLFEILTAAPRDLGIAVDLAQIFSAERLLPFQRFDRETARELFREFY